MKNPVRIEIAGKKTTLEAIEQRLHAADDMQHKNRLLKHLISDSGMTRAIIFSGTKRNADQLARTNLRAQGHSAAALHGDMSQNARNRTIMNMRRGKIRLLVATDVAARGLDVTGITHVINYDLPKNAEDYVHRIGRTGRAGATGIAISFASGKEVDSLRQIERYIGQSHPAAGDPGTGAGASLTPLKQRRQPSAVIGKTLAGSISRQTVRAERFIKNSLWFKTARRSDTDGRFSRDEKKSVRQDGGKFADFRKSKPSRQAAGHRQDTANITYSQGASY